MYASVCPEILNATSKNTSLWDTAFRTLCKEDQQAFDFSGPEYLGILDDVLVAVGEKRNLCRQKMWKFTWDEKEFILRDIADKMITWVNKFKNSRTQGDPIDLRIPWGLIRYLLEVFFLAT